MGRCGLLLPITPKLHDEKGVEGQEAFRFARRSEYCARMNQIHYEPGPIGRFARYIAGLACFIGIPFVPSFDLAWLGILALVGAGLVFVLAAVIKNPGCEITAPINVFLPKEQRISFFCPVFSPIDRLERRLKQVFSS